jgi:chemotaxis protein CheC
MNASDNFEGSLYYLLVDMAKEGIHNAARGLSSMVGEDLTVTAPVVRRVPLAEISNLLGGPEIEAVGIYLRAEGVLAGQMLMVVPYAKSLELADLVMGLPAGSTQELGRLERSALAELGNVTGSFFLNSLASITGIFIRPSPPAVLVDMIGAILDVILTSSDGLSESVLMIEAIFLRAGREIQANFWVIPDRSTLKVFSQEGQL